MITGGDKNQLMSDINVTPFVDVMLVLLIIFMVTAPMMSQGVSVSLPEAASQPLPSETDPLIITINSEHQIFINDYQVTLDFLQEKLSAIIASRQNHDVYLRADKTIPYGMVVRVMSEVKAAGVEKLGMVTEPITANGKEQKSGKRK
jgi:biopolymer transport protein TolR